MSEGSPFMQVVLTVVFAAAMFILVFAAANTEAPAPIADILTPTQVQAGSSF
ncbi:hypothetical protein [Youhaiella tibetensis]|uniref:hypothetical protein n=1 Tax=Paradevosia tibetensis TaxID=1447062 RepID=UPI000ABFB66B|nr:hypothetical protein [Youhaiella tibetensis]